MHQALALLSILLLWPGLSQATILNIGDFSQKELSGWQEKSFSGETNYTFVFDKSLNKTVLQAKSKASASGLFYEKDLDISKTPWLHWSWKTEALPQGLNERQKSGDDFVARIYVVLDGGYVFWRTVALNYVWSSSQPSGDVWPNPFTSNATMLAVESGNKNLGQWQHYSRNLLDDLRTFLGKDVSHIDAIAIMTDTDNSGQHATSWFSDIYLSDQAQATKPNALATNAQ